MSNFRRNSLSVFRRGHEIDRSVLLGALVSVTLLGVGIIASGRATTFFDLPSFAIVIGGTLGATLVHFSIKDVTNAVRDAREAVLSLGGSPAARMQYLVDLCHAVRTQGRLVVLAQEAQRVRDPFLKFAMQMAEDGQAPDDVRRILETETKVASDRAHRSVQLFETMGTYAPALGLIGTVIGLIEMLSALSNPSAIGPAMATALVTTLYGAVSANLVFLPLAGKLRNRLEEQSIMKALTIEGIISVTKEENPLLLEQRLQSFRVGAHE